MGLSMIQKCRGCGIETTSISLEIHIQNCPEYQLLKRQSKARRQLKKSLDKVKHKCN